LALAKHRKPAVAETPEDQILCREIVVDAAVHKVEMSVAGLARPLTPPIAGLQIGRSEIGQRKEEALCLLRSRTDAVGGNLSVRERLPRGRVNNRFSDAGAKIPGAPGAKGVLAAITAVAASRAPS